MDDANDWIISVERIYSISEVHSIANSKGDVSMVGVFSDNTDKTIYEFMELLEINLIGWGSNRQRANTLFNDHLSENIKSKTITISDNFAQLKDWLFKEKPFRHLESLAGRFLALSIFQVFGWQQ